MPALVLAFCLLGSVVQTTGSDSSGRGRAHGMVEEKLRRPRPRAVKMEQRQRKQRQQQGEVARNLVRNLVAHLTNCTGLFLVRGGREGVSTGTMGGAAKSGWADGTMGQCPNGYLMAALPL